MDNKTKSEELDQPTNVDLILDRRHFKKKARKWKIIGILAILILITSLIFRGMGSDSFRHGKKDRNHIAEVDLNSVILDSTYAESVLNKIAKNNKVKGLIININSPGGSTTGSEGLYLALREISKSKPVVSYIGNLAASGGYIAALGTDHIVARSNAIVGSIGVYLQWAETKELLDHIGIKLTSIKSGNLKAEPDGINPASQEAKEAIKSIVDDSFEWFSTLVKDRRKLTAREFENVASGRVFTARQALPYKLIDEIGGRKDALNWLSTKIGTDEFKKINDNLIVKYSIEEESDDYPFYELFNSVLSYFGINIQFFKPNPQEKLDGLFTLWNPTLDLSR